MNKCACKIDRYQTTCLILLFHCLVYRLQHIVVIVELYRYISVYCSKSTIMYTYLRRSDISSVSSVHCSFHFLMMLYFEGVCFL